MAELLYRGVFKLPTCKQTDRGARKHRVSASKHQPSARKRGNLNSLEYSTHTIHFWGQNIGRNATLFQHMVNLHILCYAQPRGEKVMILKTGSAPYNLFGLEALQRRLSTSRSQEINIKEKLRIANAGFNGEKVLQATFNKYKLTFEHAIYHGLSLRSSGKFQRDNLFLSRQGAFILEVKNIGGRIRFSEETNQLIRTLDNG